MHQPAMSKGVKGVRRDGEEGGIEKLKNMYATL
jgi:hypothetical protein